MILRSWLQRSRSRTSFSKNAIFWQAYWSTVRSRRPFKFQALLSSASSSPSCRCRRRFSTGLVSVVHRLWLTDHVGWPFCPTTQFAMNVQMYTHLVVSASPANVEGGQISLTVDDDRLWLSIDGTNEVRYSTLTSCNSRGIPTISCVNDYELRLFYMPSSVRPSVRACVINIVSRISHKLLFGFSPNLRLTYSWVQR